MNTLLKKALAECFGTCVLVFVACGVAVATGCDLVGTALAFGLVIIAMAYCIGNISGCHINPAVSLAMAIRKEITWKEFCVYVLSQVVGAFLGSLLLALCLRGHFEALGGNAIQPALQNGNELDAWSYISAFLVEVLLTLIFVFAIIGVTDKKFGNGKLGGLVIGLTLVLVHLLGLRLTGTSVNPARSLAPAVLQAFTGNTTSLSQIWIWILAPLAGGALAAVLYSLFFKKNEEAKEEPKEEE
ncbi:MAG: aquaporin [Acholeplasmatales bacterium]|nr:aquaporin [Acholeplasmatales bacterium]